MKKALSFCQKIENAIMVITFILMVAASFAQVVNRNIFKFGIGWFEEIAVYCMIWMALLGTEIGLRDGTQISITAIVDKLKGLPGKIIRIISKLIVCAFSIVMFRSAISMVLKQIETNQTSPALHIPMSIPYSALMVSFGIISFVQCAMLVVMIIDAVKVAKEDKS